MEAFAQCKTENVVVFPNSSDAILSAMQACNLCAAKNVTVIKSRTVAECYAALPTIDFNESDMTVAAEAITSVIDNLYIVSVAKRDQELHYRDQDISRHEYYSYAGKELIAIHKSLEETAVQTIVKSVQKRDADIITIFYQPKIKNEVESIIESARSKGLFAEFFAVSVESLVPLMTISFE